MRVYKITPGSRDNNPCIEISTQAIIDWLKDINVGDKITVRALEMSEEEYNSLPEYMGP